MTGYGYTGGRGGSSCSSSTPTRRARGTGIRRTASDKKPTTMTAAQRRAMRLRARRGR